MPELSRGDGPVRPGSMTTAMRAMGARGGGPRWLRWALIRSGRIESETVQPPERPLIVGGEGGPPGLGKPRTLLEFEAGSWVLRAWPGLAGRTDEGPIAELSDGGHKDVPLGDAARARIELEDGWSLLIQVVDRPVERLKPQLPAALQGGFFRGADWRFTGFVAASLTLHLGLIAFLLEADFPIEPLVPERYVSVIFPETDPPPVDPPEMHEGDGDEVAEVGDDQPSDTPSDTPIREPSRRADADASTRPSTPSSPESQPRIDTEAIGRDVAQQLVLAGLAPGSANSAFDAIRNGAPTTSQSSVFDAVAGTEVATNDVGVMHQRDGLDATNAITHGIGTLDHRQGRSGRSLGTDPVVEVIVTQPQGRRPILEPPTVDDPGFDSRELIRRLRARMGAVRRCYDHVLTHGNPDAAGRITLEMQVMPPGHLSGVRAADNTTGSDSLAACVVRVVRTVRVSHGSDMPVTVEFPVVLVRQN